VEEYVEIMGYLKSITSDITSMSSKFNDISDIHMIMEEYKIKLPERNNLKFKDTRETLKIVKSKLEEALETGEANEGRFKKELETEIPLVNREAEVLAIKLDDSKLANVETMITEACEILNNLKDEAEKLKDKARTLNAQERFLDQPETQFESIENVYMTFTLKNKLWNGMREYIALSENWMITKFTEIDVDGI
jgi:hypothetical protein